jgi:hypothetical protein
MAATVALAVVVVCLCLAIVALVRPSILPPPVVAFFNLGSVAPTATPQVTRASIATPTPLVWQAHGDGQAGFTINFPANWLVVSRSGGDWQNAAEAVAGDAEWVATLFETETDPAGPQSRAVDPDAVDLTNGRLVVFSAGRTPAGQVTTFEAIADSARSDPAALAALSTELVGSELTGTRTEEVMVNSRPALLVEFAGQSQFLDRAFRTRLRLYFVPAGDDLFVVSYLADELSATQNRSLYDEIVQSFAPLP